ncbi:SGNH/GDSL hydrolase family protein [Salipiger sp. 1_MG-2023]|uniref:SGNH/GDSL hydrolase family protein n=1 Tax=Salipiger sp. 1_MG-2023 TaxID=3062665 RepID=UPI0026E30B2E|nr:SGNH/GDSL hydrolase family protein [Salipiger sp. 1_MG-2023]MDO6587693.1 SGNH/GDSL hydrolase family protein [Salipiger sp. 1_MG-2023]
MVFGVGPLEAHRDIGGSAVAELDADFTSELNDHTTDTANPHGVTAAQLGLDNLPNLAAVDFPISTATQTALDGKVDAASLKAVATSGEYADLTGAPELDSFATSADVFGRSSCRPELGEAFSSEVEGSNRPAISNGARATTTLFGDVWRLTGEDAVGGLQIIAPRREIAVESGRLYRARFVFARSVDPTDPAGHFITIRMQNLGGARAALSDVTIEGMNPRVAYGAQEFSFTFGFSGTTGATYYVPDSTRYAVPHALLYGGDHETDFAVIEVLDITDTAAAVAATGDYNDLTNKPTLGTAAATAATDYATAVQGLKADGAVQQSGLDAAPQKAEMVSGDWLYGRDSENGGTTAKFAPSTVAESVADNIGGRYATAAQGAKADDALPSLEVSEESGMIFAVVDEEGRRTWLEAAPDGGPTTRAAAKVGAMLDGANTPGLLGGQEIYDESGVGVGFVDQDGRRTDLEVGPNGKFTDRVVSGLIERMLTDTVLSQISQALAVPDNFYSGPGITCLGDSLTAGAGGTPYPITLASLTGRTVTNLGVGGETSNTIVGRVGALPYLVTPDGWQIPASGGVTVTLTGADGGGVAPLLQQDRGLNPCILAGVEGTLSYSGGVYTFTRSEDGDAVDLLRPEPLRTSSWERRGDIFILWLGENDGNNDATTIIARNNAIIEWMDAMQKRWLVAGPITSTISYRQPMHDQYLAEYGRRYVNLQEYLASYAALTEAGITATTTDDDNIAIGRVPDSLRSDDTHLNTAGYTLVANCIKSRLDEFEWLEEDE